VPHFGTQISNIRTFYSDIAAEGGVGLAMTILVESTMGFTNPITRPRARWRVVVAVCIGLAAGAGYGSEPVIEVTGPSSPCVVHKPFVVECRVQWEGPADAYVVLPAEWDAVDWGAVRVISTETWGEGDTHGVTERLEVIAERAGSFELGPIRIPYAAKAAGGSNVLGADQEPATFVKSEPITVVIVAKAPLGWPIWAGIGAGVVLALAVSGALVFEARRRRGPMGPAVTPQEEIQSGLHDARRQRLDGDYYAFYVQLERALARLETLNAGDAETQTLRQSIKRRMEDTGYRGVRPSDDQMDGDIKDVERAVKRWREQSASTPQP
jgi:hypothetical protein